MFYLALIFQDVVHTFYHGPFSEQYLIVDVHQGVLHVLLDLGHQVNAIDEELLEEVLPYVAPVGEYLAEHFFMETPVLEGLSIIHVALCDKEIDDLSPFIYHYVQLKAEEPAHCSAPLGRYALEYLVLFLPFMMTGLDDRGVQERDTRTFT